MRRRRESPARLPIKLYIMHSIIQCRNECGSTYSRRGHNANASACRETELCINGSTVVYARHTILSIENGRVLLAIIHTGQRPVALLLLLLLSATATHLRRWLETTGRSTVSDRCDAVRRWPISAACVHGGCHSTHNCSMMDAKRRKYRRTRQFFCLAATTCITSASVRTTCIYTMNSEYKT